MPADNIDKSLVIRRMPNGALLPYVDGHLILGMLNCHVAYDGQMSLTTLTFATQAVGFETDKPDLAKLN